MTTSDTTAHKESVEKETPQTVVEENRIIARYGQPRKVITLVLIAALGGYLMILTLATALQLRLTSINKDEATTVYSYIVTCSGLLLLIAVPLIGALSDRTTSRFGRRKPWIFWGYALACIFMCGIGLSHNYIVIGICYICGLLCAQNAFNIFGVIPVEAVPNRYRARVMGLMGMFGAIAMPAGASLAGKLVSHPVAMMVVPMVIAIVTAIPLWLYYKDPQFTKEETSPLDLGSLVKGFFLNPRKHPNFAWVWASRFLAGVAMTSFLNFFVLYLVTNLHYSPAEAGAKAGFLSLCSAPVSIIMFSGSGYLSDKIGRRKPFVIVAALLMAIALIIAGYAPSFTLFLVAWMIFAVGQATYLTVDLALCAEVLPSQADTGKDMAVFSLALSIPTVAVPAVAPTILGADHNYQLLWMIAAILSVIGACIIPLVKGVK